MTRKYLLLLTIVAFVGLLFGCHTGGHAPFANPGRNGEPAQTLTATVNANGKLDTPIVFSSGATINTTENNTMQEGVVVNVTETKTSSLGVNPMGEPAYIYVYTITANLITQDALGNDVSTPVSSLEKPITITLPTEHLGTTGIAYVGIRASESEPWRFSKVSEDGNVTISIRNLRASSTEKLSSSYKFGLFKMGIQLALFVYNKPVEETSSDISADSLNVTCTEKILYDDSDKYTDDLDVALKIKGINLDRLRASDFAIKVIYRSENKTPESIKADGQTCGISTEEKADAAVSGKSYFVHTLTVPALNEGNLMSGEAGLKFTLNLKGIATADFPTSFLVEISNKGNIEKLIPFTYSNSMEFTAEKASTPGPEPGPNPEPTGSTYTITYNLDGGSLVEGFTNPSEYGEASETFKLNNPTKEGYTFAGWTGSNGDVPQKTLSIAQGSKSDMTFTANWTINSYRLDLIAGTGIATVTGSGTYEYNSSVTASCTMEAGYEFVSWTGDFTTETFTMPAQNATMTANAKLITYIISYDLATGTLATANPASYDVTSATITLNNPTREGFDFIGWTGTDIATGTASKTVTIPLGSTGNKSYVASWTESSPFLTITLAEGVTMELKPCGNTDMFIGTYEVTQEQYYAIMGTNPSYFRGGLETSENPHGQTTASCPVECVSWNDIMMAENCFIAKLNASDTIQAYLTAKGLSGYQFALPTKNQWKTACDAGTTTEDSDDNVNDRAWYSANWGADNTKTHEVGYKSPNAWGLYDMRGNVWEWTLTESDSRRIVCGGSWNVGADGCRSSSYSSYGPGSKNYNVGFRVALVAPFK